MLVIFFTKFLASCYNTTQRRLAGLSSLSLDHLKKSERKKGEKGEGERERRGKREGREGIYLLSRNGLIWILAHDAEVFDVALEG